VATCPVGSSLVVAFSYAGFGLAFTLPRQMLPTGQVPTQHFGFICISHFDKFCAKVGFVRLREGNLGIRPQGTFLP